MLTTELIPAAEPASKALLVVLHGLGDSMEGWRWLPEQLRLPWLNYLLVNAPDDYYGGYSWYDLYGDSGPGIRRSRDLLFQVLDAQRAAGFPSAQTGLLGFSQGCLMTFDAGFRYPHRLAALVGISGYVWEPSQMVRELSPVAQAQPALFTHGRRDPLIPMANVRDEQVPVLRAAGLNVTWREFDKVHTVAGEPELAVIREFLTQAFREPQVG
jgi:phospholipase/carboxylesterase